MSQSLTFKLRELSPADAEVFAQHANNPKIAHKLTNQFPHPYTKEDAITFINKVSATKPPFVFTIDIDGSPCGGIGIHAQTDVYTKNMELGYWLAEPYWGRGIITEAIKQIVDYGFKTFDVTRIFARPYGDNIPSQRVLEKAGFTLEARLTDTFYKNGEFKDELIYAIRKS